MEPLEGFAYDVELKDVTECLSREGTPGCYYPPRSISLSKKYCPDIFKDCVGITGNMMERPMALFVLDDKQTIWNKKYNPAAVGVI